MSLTAKSVVSVVAFLLLNGCVGAGNVAFTTWGEEYIEDAIPSAEFEDGWQIKFSKFNVVIQDIKVASSKGGMGSSMSGQKVFDLTKKGPVDVVKFEKLPADRWNEVSYAIAPASGSATAGNADAADVTKMNTDKLSLHVIASATKGSITKTFDWAFTTKTGYVDCESAEGGKGVVIPTGSTATVQLTIHGDHLFYDDLQSPDAKLRFDAIAAADANSDGTVTLEELAAVSLTTLPLTQYGTGGAAQVKNLRDFVTSLSRTVGHYQGEGECTQKIE